MMRLVPDPCKGEGKNTVPLPFILSVAHQREVEGSCDLPERPFQKIDWAVTFLWTSSTHASIVT